MEGRGYARGSSNNQSSDREVWLRNGTGTGNRSEAVAQTFVCATIDRIPPNKALRVA
jgi:hypothetical protein